MQKKKGGNCKVKVRSKPSKADEYPGDVGETRAPDTLLCHGGCMVLGRQSDTPGYSQVHSGWAFVVSITKAAVVEFI